MSGNTKVNTFKSNVFDGLLLSHGMLGILRSSSIDKLVDIPLLDSRKRNIAMVLNMGSRPGDIVGLGYPALFEPCHCEIKEESVLWWTDMQTSCMLLLET